MIGQSHPGKTPPSQSQCGGKKKINSPCGTGGRIVPRAMILARVDYGKTGQWDGAITDATGIVDKLARSRMNKKGCKEGGKLEVEAFLEDYSNAARYQVIGACSYGRLAACTSPRIIVSKLRFPLQDTSPAGDPSYGRPYSSPETATERRHTSCVMTLWHGECRKSYG
jgi:hypothetical protein